MVAWGRLASNSRALFRVRGFKGFGVSFGVSRVLGFRGLGALRV